MMKLAAVIVYLIRYEILLVTAKYVVAHERSVPASLIVHWNSSNPIFHIDNTDHVFVARIRDQLNIFCPKWPMGTPEKQMEYTTVYRVNRTEYDNCMILQEEPKIAAFCTHPDDSAMSPQFTISLREFTPNPKGMQFLPNNDYFFISTSDGTRKGILNRRGGLCKDRNMKIRIRVLPRGDANDPRLGYSVTVSESPSPPPHVEIFDRYDYEPPLYDKISKATGSSSSIHVLPKPQSLWFLFISIIAAITVQIPFGFR